MLKRGLFGLSVIFGLSCVFGLSSIASTPTATVKTSSPHWQKNPIRVYIPKNDPYAMTVRNAFMRWQNASSNKINFSFVDKGPADIDIVFNENASGDTPISTYSTTSSENKITKAEIHVATKGKTIKKYSRNYVYIAMLHEVGHVLGLSHSDRKQTSIMYPTIHESQQIMKLDVMKLYYANDWSWMDRRISK